MEIEYRSSYFVYILTDDQRTHFNVNITTNLQSLLKPIEAPENVTGATSCLLYYEQYHDKFLAVKRETELAFLPQRRLRKLVLAVNPRLERITEPSLLPES